MENQPSQPGDLINSNDDLLTEIFVRLPVTSILRFRSVCKHWRWLLSERSFTLKYDKLSKSPGIFAGDTYVPFDVNDPSTPPFRRCFKPCCLRILHSCNGLLLLSCNRGSNGVPVYYVFSPTTKLLATVPPVPGGPKVGISIDFMALAFHQTDCVHYKVVCIRSLQRDGELYQVQVFSSDTRTWKISIKSFFAHKPNFRNTVYWNGAVYWAPSYDTHLYFKLDDECLHTLPLPVEMMSSSRACTMCFGESRGHLHLVVNTYAPSLTLPNAYVYELLSDHSGWFAKYHVERPEIPGALYLPNFMVVDVIRGEEEEDTFMVLVSPRNMLITYNVHDKSFKPISSIPTAFSGFHRYTETLASF